MTNETTALDLIERLRYPINGMRPTLTDGRAAANALEAAQARIAELEGALGPFSEVAGTLFAKNYNAGDLVVDEGPMMTDCLTFQNFLDARAALEGKG